MANLAEICGVLASVFTGIALLPQLLKLIKEKRSGDTSPLMLISLFIGLAFWVGYGFLKKDWIILVSNSFSLLVNINICILSVYYHGKEKSM